MLKTSGYYAVSGHNGVRRKSESEWQYNARILPRVMSRDSPRNYDTLDSDTHGSVSTVCQTNFTAKRSRASDNCNNNEINRVYKPKSNTCIEVGNRNLYGVTLENVHSAPQIQTKVDKNGNYCEPSSFPGFEVTEREETAQTCPTYIANYMRFQTLPASTPTNGNSSPEPHFVYESFPTPTDLVKVNRKKLKVKTNRDGVLIERRRTQSRSIFAGDQIGDPNGPAAKPQAERLVRNTAKPVLGERKQSWVTKPPRITCTPQIPPGSRRITRFQTTVDEEVVTAKTNRQNLSRLPKQPEATAKAWSRTTVGRETVTTKTTQRDLVTLSKQPETIHGDNGNIETAEQEFAGSEKQVHRKSSVEKLNGITDTPKTVTRSLYQGIRPTAEQHVDPKSSSAKMNGIPDPTMTITRSLDQRNRPGGEKGVEVRSSRTHLNGVPQVSRRANSAITVDHHQPLQQHTPLPQSREVSIKVVLLGDYGVGKSRLLQAFRKASSLGKTGIRCAEYRPKEFVELTMTEGERRLRVKIVDTAGQERFRSLTSSYFRGAHGCLLVFSVTMKDSFDNVMQWYSEMQKYSDITSTLLLGISNPSQSREVREVTSERAFKLAEGLQTHYLETTMEDAELLLWCVQILSESVAKKLVPAPRAGPLNMITISPSTMPRNKFVCCAH